jgi:hypothetical protein
MKRSSIWLIPIAAAVALTHCSTEACGCTPDPATAVVHGRVTSFTSQPVSGAGVVAHSGSGEGCRVGFYGDYGGTLSDADGSYVLELADLIGQDSVCILVSARPPAGSAELVSSDTTRVVLEFRYIPPWDSARVDPVLRSPS